MENKINTKNGEYVKPLTFILLMLGMVFVALYISQPPIAKPETDTYFVIGIYPHQQDNGVSITAGTTNGLTHKSFNTSYPFKLGHAYFILSEGDKLISVVEVKLD
jgi:hypothetical protein